MWRVEPRRSARGAAHGCGSTVERLLYNLGLRVRNRSPERDAAALRSTRVPTQCHGTACPPVQMDARTDEQAQMWKESGARREGRTRSLAKHAKKAGEGAYDNILDQRNHRAFTSLPIIDGHQRRGCGSCRRL